MKYYAIKWVKNGAKIKLGIDLPNASLLYFIYLSMYILLSFRANT